MTNPSSADPLLLPRPRSASFGPADVAARPPATRIDPTLPAEGYRLRVSASAVTLDGGDDAGIHWGRTTLAQLEAGARPGRLPEALVEDWPDLPVRGLMLDVSRDKVPTMAGLLALVDRLSSWKLNHLELYTEHTFAYAGHDEVWRHAGPVTPDELDELVAYGAARQVQVVPNQNCLGHMERWLAVDRYRPLAVSPHGWSDERGRRRHPTTLEPTDPASLALVRDLLSQLLARAPGPLAHVGLDEPWELAATGRTADYLDFVERLRRAPELDGRTMLMWGDIVAAHPDLAARLPDGVTVCEWGYEADHPFAARTEPLAAAGVPYWLCPGTSSWNSLAGRLSNVAEGCRRAADAGAGAAGYLVTDWGDNGHLQPFVVSLPALAQAAGSAWCAAANRHLDLAAVLDRMCFDDPTSRTGRALSGLGEAWTAVDARVPNSSALVLHLLFPQVRVGVGFTAGLDDGQLDRWEAVVDGAEADLASARPAASDGDLVVAELRQTASLLRLAGDDARARLRGDGRLTPVPEAERAALADRAGALADEHRRLWLARNRPGGLADSAARLQHLSSCYRRGEGTGFRPAWQAWIDAGPGGGTT